MEIPGLSQDLLKMTKEELIMELIKERQEHEMLKEENEKNRKQLVTISFRQITAVAERDALKVELEKAKQELLRYTQKPSAETSGSPSRQCSSPVIKSPKEVIVIKDTKPPPQPPITITPPLPAPSDSVPAPSAPSPSMPPPSPPSPLCTPKQRDTPPIKYVDSPDATYLMAAQKLENEYNQKKLLRRRKKQPTPESTSRPIERKEALTSPTLTPTPPSPSSVLLTLVLDDDGEIEQTTTSPLSQDYNADQNAIPADNAQQPEPTLPLSQPEPQPSPNSLPVPAPNAIKVSRLSISKRTSLSQPGGTSTATQKPTLSNLPARPASQSQPVKVLVPPPPPPKQKKKKPLKPLTQQQQVPPDSFYPSTQEKASSTQPPSQSATQQPKPLAHQVKSLKAPRPAPGPKTPFISTPKPPVQTSKWGDSLPSFLKQLNPKQQEAVTKDISRPLVVIAGAGSGKTFTLCSRIAYILSQGVPAHQIIALTFTRAAAEELKKRVKKMIIDDGHKNFGFDQRTQFYLQTGTFHSFCFSILNLHCEHLGFNSKKLTICSDKKLESIVREGLKAWERKKNGAGKLEIQPTEQSGDKGDGFSNTEVDIYVNFIRRAKSEGKSPNEYAGDYAFIYQFYQDRLKENNSIDFTDMLCLTVQLFKENEKILKLYRDKHRYVLVDEFQDTNRVQFELLWLLTKESGRLTVVGDDDQCIYNFRGSDSKHIQSLDKYFIGPRTPNRVILDQNYRSTKSIINSANSLIKVNEKRLEKKMWTDNIEGNRICVMQCKNPEEEALLVANTMSELHKSGKYRWGDMAILYRLRNVSPSFEKQLKALSIPFTAVGKLSLTEREEVKDILAYLKLALDREDNLAFERICNKPTRGLGSGAIKYIREITAAKSAETKLSLFAASTQIVKDGFPLLAGKKLGPKQQTALKKFLTIINQIAEHAAQEKTPLEVIEFITKTTAYAEYLKKKSLQPQLPKSSKTANDREGNLEELKKRAQDFFKENWKESQNDEPEEEDGPAKRRIAFLKMFLEWLLTQNADEDTLDEGKKAQKMDFVSLTTIHQAKGLEWPVVFLVRFNNGVIPAKPGNESGIEKDQQSHFPLSPEAHLEEERRLAYVSITRARQQLYISYALANAWGQPSSSSIFLQEISPTHLELVKSEDLLKDMPAPPPAQSQQSESSESGSAFTTAADLIRKEKEKEEAKKEEYPILKSKFFTPSSPAKSSIFKKMKETGWRQRSSSQKRAKVTWQDMVEEESENQENRVDASMQFSQEPKTQKEVSTEESAVIIEETQNPDVGEEKSEEEKEDKEEPSKTVENGESEDLLIESPFENDREKESFDYAPEEAEEEEEQSEAWQTKKPSQSRVVVDQSVEKPAEEEEVIPSTQTEKKEDKEEEEKTEERKASPKRKLDTGEKPWAPKPAKRRKRFISEDLDEDDLLSTNSNEQESSERDVLDSEPQEEVVEAEEAPEEEKKDEKEKEQENKSEQDEKEKEKEKEKEEEEKTKDAAQPKSATQQERLSPSSKKQAPAKAGLKKTSPTTKKSKPAEADSKTYRPITSYFTLATTKKTSPEETSKENATGEAKTTATVNNNLKAPIQPTTKKRKASEEKEASKENEGDKKNNKTVNNKKKKVEKGDKTVNAKEKDSVSEPKKKETNVTEKGKAKENGTKKTTKEKETKEKGKKEKEEATTKKVETKESQEKRNARARAEAIEGDGEQYLSFTSGETCPSCSVWVAKPDIEKGWRHRKDGETERDSYRKDITTKCPGCSHRFIAQMTVKFRKNNSSSKKEKEGKAKGKEMEEEEKQEEEEIFEFLGPKQLVYRAKVRMKREGTQSFKPLTLAEKDSTLFWNLIQGYGSLKQALLEIFPDKNLNAVFLKE